jgi:hypothetical protein
MRCARRRLLTARGRAPCSAQGYLVPTGAPPSTGCQACEPVLPVFGLCLLLPPVTDQPQALLPVPPASTLSSRYHDDLWAVKQPRQIALMGKQQNPLLLAQLANSRGLNRYQACTSVWYRGTMARPR